MSSAKLEELTRQFTFISSKAVNDPGNAKYEMDLYHLTIEIAKERALLSVPVGDYLAHTVEKPGATVAVTDNSESVTTSPDSRKEQRTTKREDSASAPPIDSKPRQFGLNPMSDKHIQEYNNSTKEEIVVFVKQWLTDNPNASESERLSKIKSANALITSINQYKSRQYGNKAPVMATIPLPSQDSGSHKESWITLTPRGYMLVGIGVFVLIGGYFLIKGKVPQGSS